MDVDHLDPFFEPYCVVLVLQHYYKCSTSLLVFTTADPTRFTVWECPMPWHTLCFPQAYELCKEALPGELQMDPFTFVRRIGWPGKVLFCFATQGDRSFTDVWSYCPLDPLPLVPSEPIAGPMSSDLNPVLVRGNPLWTVQRYWGVAVPQRFWESRIQQYICTEKALSVRRKLEALMIPTYGLVPIENFFEPPVPDNISELEDMQIHEVNVYIFPIFDT